jgi:hypothetical protein
MSGGLGDGVLNIDGKGALGVQLRNLDAVLDAHERAEPNAGIGICRIKVHKHVRECWDCDLGLWVFFVCFCLFLFFSSSRLNMC